jgi:2-isopropylmalate synthase
LLDSTDGHETWGSIGVSENIIEASWEALVDSLEHAFQEKSKIPPESSADASGSAGSVAGRALD